MSLTFINADKGPIPIGPYSHAVKGNGLIYLSGFCGINQNAQLLGNGDIKLETKYALENLKNVIEAAGSKFENIMKVNIFITDLNKYGDLNTTYADYFRDFKPARSCVEVKALPIPNATVEIEAVALS